MAGHLKFPHFFSVTALIIIWTSWTIRVSAGAPNHRTLNFLDGERIKNSTGTIPLAHASLVENEKEEESGSKPPLVQMADWNHGSQSHRNPRSAACEDTENPCNCCCINCWEYLNWNEIPGVCYDHCAEQFNRCDCAVKRAPDYD